MQKILFSIVLLFLLSNGLASCNPKSQTSDPIINSTISNNKMKINIGEKVFIATLNDSPTATAFKAMLPLTLTMNELNNNEKYAQLPKNLTTNASIPTSIQSGDLMMYGSSTLVLFYKSFNTTYSYTKLGQIDDVNGLQNALSNDNVLVSFELQ